jgi:hypothetical protein
VERLIRTEWRVPRGHPARVLKRLGLAEQIPRNFIGIEELTIGVPGGIGRVAIRHSHRFASTRKAIFL